MNEIYEIECRKILLQLLSEKKVLFNFAMTLSLKAEYRGIITIEEIIPKHTKLVDKSLWIDKMGRWSSTSQGHDFWKQMHEELNRRLNKLASEINNCNSIW